MGEHANNQKQQKSLFLQDVPNMILLTVLYSFQGLPQGLFLSSVPLLFKKYLTYKELGYVMLSTMPYSYKVFWAPVVELYYFQSMGRRKSWVIPCQFVGSMILLYLAGRIEDLIMTKELTWLTALLIFNTFVITCQDIAVDSWAVEILHPENASYQSVSQSVGQRLGSIASTTLFVSLNSVDFCNLYIFKEPSDKPLLTLEQFIWTWAVVQMMITFYILIFVPEKKQASVGQEDNNDEEEEELVIYPSQSPAIIWDIMSNPYLLKYLFFLFFTCGTYAIDFNVTSVYLTNELKFSKESLSIVKIVSAPANIIVAFASGYFAQSKPFTFFFYTSVFCIFTRSYSVLVMLQNFPKDQEAQMQSSNILHITAVVLINELADNFWFVTAFAIVAKITDLRIAGIHITLLASLTNQAQFLHKFYIFTLVDNFGPFVPQMIISVLGLICCFWLKDDIFKMDQLPVKTWFVSDKIINANQKAKQK